MLLADRGYDSGACRAKVEAQGAAANIRPLSHRTAPTVFNKRNDKLRNRIEWFFTKIKHFRTVATRFDKHDDNFLASVKLAAIRLWMRFNESVS